MADHLVKANLPLSFSEITPAWLTEALSTRFPGVRVVETKREDERYGTAASARFYLIYADRGITTDLPGTVYVKGGFDNKWRKRVWMALQQEARFYADLAPDIHLNIPKCYFQGISDAPQGIVILEDIVSRGVRFGADLAPVTVDDVAAVLEQIAHLHAQWWGNPRLAAYDDWGIPQRVYLKYLYRPKHWEELIARTHGEMLVKVLGTQEIAVRSLERLWEINDVKPRTLLHGDPHGGNLFYETDGRPGFLDWQLTFPGTYSHDMAWVIVTSLTVEQRRASERMLLRHYLNVLKSLTPEAPNADDVWLAYRQNMAHAIVSYGAAPHDNGPSEVIKGSALRVFTAANDLDVLDSLGLQ